MSVKSEKQIEEEKQKILGLFKHHHGMSLEFVSRVAQMSKADTKHYLDILVGQGLISYKQNGDLILYTRNN